jgi:putative spermidine/putrescine transport system permease protein
MSYRVGLWCTCGVVFVFLLAPIFAIVPLSFSSGSMLVYPLPGFSTRWYAEALGDPRWRVGLLNSMWIGAWATLFATVLGTLAALALARQRAWWAQLAKAIALSPMIVPVVVIAVGTYFFFSPYKLVASFTGLVLAHTVIAVPFVLITVLATVEQLSPNLARAATSLGANPTTTFFRVTLPLIAPGVASGAVFAFATSFDDVVLSIFLSGPEQRTLPREMFSGIRDKIEPTLMAVATMMIAFSSALFLTIAWLKRRSAR